MAETVRDYLELGRLDRAADNIEKVRDAYRCLEKGDFDGFSASFADEAAVMDPHSLPYGGVYHGGRKALKELADKMFGSWETVGWSLQEFTGGGDLVSVHIIMTFKPHGKPAFDHPIVENWGFRDGKVVDFRVFYGDTKMICDILA